MLVNEVSPTRASISQARRSGCRSIHGLAAAGFVAALSLLLWSRGAAAIARLASEPAGINRLVSADSRHYLDIAASFAAGDFSMSYVKPSAGPDRAHRQPLYPLVLAAAQRFGLSGPIALARVNLALLVACLWTAYWIGRELESAAAAALGAAIVYQTPFLFENATQRLLTEPLYLLVTCAALAAALRYLRSGSTAWLPATFLLAACAYLTRPNGLFFAVALACALAATAACRALRRSRPSEDAALPMCATTTQATGERTDGPTEDVAKTRQSPKLAAVAATVGEAVTRGPQGALRAPVGRAAAPAWLLALIVFVAASSPSWLPRLVYTGNPLYHGYLSNYMWVDDHERAHVPGQPLYTWKTYAATHSVSDALSRAGYGVRRVFYETPRDKIGAAASLAALASLLLLLCLRETNVLALAAAGILQALPLAWTMLANPARRVPAAAMLPFMVLVTAAAAAAIGSRMNSGARPRISARRK